MKKRTEKRNPRRLRQQTTDLRRQIGAMDYVSSGTLHSRTRPCGKTNCRCAQDAEAWHGPYHDWTRRKHGRLVHNAVSPEQASLIRRAIDNRREIERLLVRWEEETVAEILGGVRSSG